MAFHRAMDWHEGEKRIHQLTHNLCEDNPTSPFLTPRAAALVSRYTLMSLGTLDVEDRPWCTVWGTGDPPLAQQVAQSVLGIRSTVDASFDPVVQELFGGRPDGEVVRETPPGRMVSGLSCQLDERGRVKLYGRMIAGALSSADSSDSISRDASNGRAAEVQLVLKIEQSLGNCPKYLNKKTISSHTPQPVLLSSSPHLSDEAIELIHRADLFFIASAHEHEDMDTNHRGGPPGFIRVFNPPPPPPPAPNTTSTEQDPANGSVIVWPEYSGNNLYQTLGNLTSTPRAGLCIPDFLSGDVVYLTGTTEVLVGRAASSLIAKSGLAVKLTVTAAKHVRHGLPFRGTPVDDGTHGLSPYNPRVRFLASERVDEFSSSTPGIDKGIDNGATATATGATGTATGATGTATGATTVTAKLIQKTPLTPTITRYRFSLSDPLVHGPWKPGQYVAMDFSNELDMGYQHMRDDDPRSLNDDWLRTFTVSSVPGRLGVQGEEFEITARKVGNVTGFLAWQRVREGGLEVGVRGFGGEFRFDFGVQNEDDGRDGKDGRNLKVVGFVAAGIGITPLLGQMGEFEGAIAEGRVRVLWSVGVRDVGLVQNTIQDFPNLTNANVLSVFLTGDAEALEQKERQNAKESLRRVREMGVNVQQRRLMKRDLDQVDEEVDEWYLCTAPAMRQQVQDWLPGKSIVFENFDY